MDAGQRGLPALACCDRHNRLNRAALWTGLLDLWTPLYVTGPATSTGPCSFPEPVLSRCERYLKPGFRIDNRATESQDGPHTSRDNPVNQLVMPHGFLTLAGNRHRWTCYLSNGIQLI